MRNWNAIRTKASRLLASAGVSSLPVPVEDIARGLGLVIIETDELEKDVSGLLVRKDGNAWIFVRKLDSEQRKRFTIAHEIGHYFLGHEFGAIHVDRGYRIHARGPQARTGEVVQEVEANQFAAALLMPEEQVRVALGRRGKTYADDIDVNYLATAFGVSEQAMTIRLTSLGLL